MHKQLDSLWLSDISADRTGAVFTANRLGKASSAHEHTEDDTPEVLKGRSFFNQNCGKDKWTSPSKLL